MNEATNTKQAIKVKAARIMLNAMIVAGTVSIVVDQALATTIVDTANTGLNTIYSDARKLTTVAAAVAAVISLLFSLFTRDEKKIGASRAIAKGAIITWAVIMLLPQILEYAYKLIGVSGTVTLGQ